MERPHRPTAISFDLFGTLIEVHDQPDVTTALECELTKRGVNVPSGWERKFMTPQLALTSDEELSLVRHSLAVLAACGLSIDDRIEARVNDAILKVFDRKVTPRPGAIEAIHSARGYGPVGILSNCSVPGIVEQMLDRAGMNQDWFDAICSSVDIGWRKPHPRAFETMAEELDIRPERLLHIGDDRVADSGAKAVGATVALTEGQSLIEIVKALEEP